MIRRINLFGGPGSGKSTMAARLFAELKSRNESVELVHEYVKMDAYKKQYPKSFGQLRVFSAQLNLEDERLEFVDKIVTDSPILMSIAYAKEYNFCGWQELLALALKYELEYPSYNFFIKRKWDFVKEGRFQDESRALALDKSILDLMKEHSNNYAEVESIEEILDHYDFCENLEVVEKDEIDDSQNT